MSDRKSSMCVTTVLLYQPSKCVINLSCAFMRMQNGSLTRATFRSPRNDALANVAIIAAGFMTAYALSEWLDLIHRSDVRLPGRDDLAGEGNVHFLCSSQLHPVATDPLLNFFHAG